MSLPKAVLYYYPESIWSAVVLLALEEKGYGDDEVDLRIVDLSKGEQFAPTFLRLNPKATVPTLVVPLEKTLSHELESRYKALTESTAIVEFLDKSRSALSKTHTTSSAPAPALAPATIAFTATSNLIIDEIIHSEHVSPRTLRYMNARDQPALIELAKDLLPKISGRKETLDQYIAGADNGTIHVSDKVKRFWAEKREAIVTLIDVYTSAEKPAAELTEVEREKREEFFATAKTAWEVSLRDALIRLNKEIIGPYALGDQLSLADIHLAGALARLVKLSGGTAADDGNTAVGKLEAHVGEGFTLPKDFQQAEAQRMDTAGPAGTQSKLAAFWDAAKERASWKKVYGDGLR